MEKKALLKSITEKLVDSGPSWFNSVCGSGTFGDLIITDSFTGLISCTILHPVDGSAFFTGKIAVLTGESEQGLIIPLLRKSVITGRIPSIASGFRGYCRALGLCSVFGLILTGSKPFISPTSALPWDHRVGGSDFKA